MIWKANQWTGFYMITPSFEKELISSMIEAKFGDDFLIEPRLTENNNLAKSANYRIVVHIQKSPFKTKVFVK